MPCLAAVCHSVTSLAVHLPPGWKGPFIRPRIQPSRFMSLCQIVHLYMWFQGSMSHRTQVCSRIALCPFFELTHCHWSGSDLQFSVQVAGWAWLLCLQFKSRCRTTGSAEWNQTADGVTPWESLHPRTYSPYLGTKPTEQMFIMHARVFLFHTYMYRKIYIEIFGQHGLQTLHKAVVKWTV